MQEKKVKQKIWTKKNWERNKRDQANKYKTEAKCSGL